MDMPGTFVNFHVVRASHAAAPTQGSARAPRAPSAERDAPCAASAGASTGAATRGAGDSGVTYLVLDREVPERIVGALVRWLPILLRQHAEQRKMAARDDHLGRLMTQHHLFT